MSWLHVGIWIVVIGLLAFIAVQYHGKNREQTTQRMASPAMGMAFAVLALLAGTISQFYPDPIKQVFPLVHLHKPAAWAGHAFWITVVLTAATGMFYYAATGRERRKEVESLREETAAVVDTIRTLPPEGFMRDFPRLCSTMMAAYAQAIVEGTPEAIRDAIRIALRTAAEMANAFDHGDGNERYSANVMRYYDRADLPPTTEWTDDDWHLYPRGYRPDPILGALVLDPHLASFADTNEPVAGMHPIRIVIPDPPRDAPAGNEAEGDLRMLPGSAVAFHLGTAYLATDTWSIRTPNGSPLRLEEALMQSAEAYFRDGAGRSVRSFVSLPLFVSPAEMAGERIGILNVESSEPRIFGGDRDRVRNFHLAIAPVHFVIVSLLALLQAPATTPASDE